MHFGNVVHREVKPYRRPGYEGTLIIDPDGIIRPENGDRIDLHNFFGANKPSVYLMQIVGNHLRNF